VTKAVFTVSQEFLKVTLRHNAYSTQQIHWALKELVDTVVKRDLKLYI
jgi:hypothetical protein